MPCTTVRDAFYTPIGGISYCRARHLHHSYKASERPLEGIPMSEPPILQCRDSKIEFLFVKQDKQCSKFTSTSTKSSKTIVFVIVSGGGSEI